jgi:hypothetical protein
LLGEIVLARTPKPSGLKRPVAKLPERRTFLIFTEGEVTEVEYLNALKSLPEVKTANAVDLQIASQRGVPLTLVELAVEAQSKNDEIDQIWCVFDVEWPKHHPHLNEAKLLAQNHGIQLAISNPNFELWLILHHANTEGFLDNDGARRLRRDHDGVADKHLDHAVYLPLRAAATMRAIDLDAKHRNDGTKFPSDNPSSGMHRLLRAIEPGLLEV